MVMARSQSEKPLAAEGFLGMWDTMSPHRDARLPLWLNNCYVHEDGRIVLRDGWQRGSTSTVATQGSAPQRGLITTFRDRIIYIGGGKLYDLAVWGGPTEKLNSTDFSGASITLDTSSYIYAVEFAGQLIVSDGVNVPWAWDGTLHGGLTKLTNAPVAYQAPTVYYAKLFFIKNSDRRTMVWSEENQVNTGYEAGGYNNAWTLEQTGSQELTHLLGTNEQLYYFRLGSMGAVRGAVTPTFSTDGTHDGISSTVGSPGGRSVAFDGADVWFIDMERRLWRMPMGGAPQSLRQNTLRESRFSLSGNYPYLGDETLPFNLGEDAALTAAQPGIMFDLRKGHVFVIGEDATGAAESAMRYRMRDGQLLGREAWSGYGGKGVFAGARGNGYSAVAAVSDNGVVAWLGGSGGLASARYYGADQPATTGSTTYTATIIGAMQGYRVRGEWKFSELSVVADTNDTTSSTISADFLTDRAHYSTLIAAAMTGSVTDTNFQTKEQRLFFGIRGHGSWIRVRLRITATDRVAIKGWEVAATNLSGNAVAVA